LAAHQSHLFESSPPRRPPCFCSRDIFAAVFAAALAPAEMPLSPGGHDNDAAGAGSSSQIAI
jgi:hypothetical protein